jgi:hypothetical protein
MRSNRTRVAVVVGSLAVLVALFVILSGGDGDDNDTTTATQPGQGTTAQGTTAQAGRPAGGESQAIVNVSGGKPVGGVQKLSFKKGDQVRFRVNSDVTDEIHVHGYDFHKDVEAGGSVSFSFPAKIEGVFEVELEDRGEQIAQLSVRPS